MDQSILNIVLWFLVFFGFFKLISKLTRRKRGNEKKDRRYRNDDDFAQKRAGEEGEEIVRRILVTLPPTQKVLENVFIPKSLNRGDFSTELDHIIIGPSGIILVETKNWSGQIMIEESGWYRVIDGEKVPAHENISAQCIRHEEGVERFLETMGVRDRGDVNIPIHSVVAMTNHNAQIIGKDEFLPVMRADNLPVWIKRLPNMEINQDKIDEIYEVFSDYLKER